jgi:zinc protease
MFKGFKGQGAQSAAETFDASPANIDARTQRLSLPNGMQVALLPKSTRGQAVKATLTLRFGNESSLAGWGQVPEALAALLDKGTQSMTRQQLQDKLDALQAEVGFSAADGQLNVGLSTTRAHLPALIALVGEVLRSPLLPADGLDEVRRQALAGLEEQSKEPAAVLQEALSRHGNPYPKGDVRYAPTLAETQAEWRDVSLDKVKQFHKRFVAADHAQFAAVGDMDAKAVEQALGEAFGQWRGQEAYAPIAHPLVKVDPIRLQLATPDKQNATMSVVLALPLSDRDADYPALMLANHLLGSGGDSRLWNRIREKEGLSYSVYSSVQWNPVEANSSWVAQAIFAPQNRVKVETAFKQEIDRALSQGFTPNELEAGRKGLLNFRRLGRAQDARLAAGWSSNLYLGRTFAVSAQVDEALSKVTLDQVNAALRKYIKPSGFVMGVAGDFK